MTEKTKGLIEPRIEAVLSKKPPEDASVHDKIRWLNAYDLSDLKVQCVDKIRAKEHVAKICPEVKCARTIQVFDKVEDIYLPSHPKKFVMKKNSGCRRNMYCWDKSLFNIKNAADETRKWMSETPGLNSDEFQYTLVTPHLFTEECLTNGPSESLLDYRFWVFENKCRFVAVNGGHGWGGQQFFDTQFNRIDLYNNAHKGDAKTAFSKPRNFDAMVSYAEKLSTGFKFVRVDLYNVDGDVYFGEFTFSPGGYFTRFVDSSGKSLDVEIGRYLHI